MNEHGERRLVRHQHHEHMEGEACTVCQSVDHVIERTVQGGYVLLQATAVHTHACPSWRIGQRHGPCNCGVADAWERWREHLVSVVFAS